MYVLLSMHLHEYEMPGYDFVRSFTEGMDTLCRLPKSTYMRLSKYDQLQTNMNVVIQLEDLKEYVGQSLDKNAMCSKHISVFWFLSITTYLPYITGHIMLPSIISIGTKLPYPTLQWEYRRGV